MIKMAVAQKMENKFCANGLGEKKNLQKRKKNRRRRGKKGKAYTRSAGLVKFRGTVGPYKVGEKV